MRGQMMFQALTTGSLIDHAARYHAGTEIVSVATLGGVERTCWSEVSANARRLASALDQLGVAAGARCGTIAWNNRRHLEIYFGVGAGGRVTHTINPRLSPEHLIYIINDAADEILFFDHTFLPFIPQLRPHLTTVKHYVLMGPRDEEASNTLDGLQFFDELITSGDAQYTWPELDETTPAALCYTSGTTGKPKGVLNSHRSLVLHALGGNQPDGTCISARDSLLPVVPMFHVNAWGIPFIAAIAGARLVLPGPNLDGDSLLKLLTEEKVNVAFGVPTIWMGLLATLKSSGAQLPDLERSFVGGTALPPSMISTFRDDYGVELIHAWGMTETTPIGTINMPLHKHGELPLEQQREIRHAQGRPIFGVELRVVDAEGNTLPNDGKSQGNLQVRGHWVIERYYSHDKNSLDKGGLDKEGKEENTLTDDGWFDTGDIATLDENGYLIIRDRAKDIIKSGGEWISTVDLENIAIAHPGVANAAAIAAWHPRWDERPVLVCVRAEGSDVEESQLLADYEGKVAKWQIPDRAIFVDALPMSATGKVLKNRLRDEYGQILAEDRE
ncbi:long-chain-fatty-acid--CoA ligase [Halomonas cupida]|uniref:Fatty-acyl-CoA synthase n=1 Tax=Halomonas cupida TaxID=44933 RepID=A0A1M7JQA3_9GAMM|nr:long-chain fatty acid--CoA ligase [Halomonas cupida]GEN24517.1 long-chain-fatty-acid--CoA ligase [Halomonas cupida]SHM55269.1 fatty-acyl-CoA synthase [Halomonas cupida]